MAYRGPNPENWNKSSLSGDTLRPDIVANKSLVRLFLEHNTLTSFPTNLHNMSALTELWLSHNRIETIDDQVIVLSPRESVSCQPQELLAAVKG